MNTNSLLLFLRFRLPRLLLPVLGAVGLLGFSSMANAENEQAAYQVTNVSGHKAYSQTLTFSDLDLATPEGEQTANNRLHEAAKHMCRQASEANDRSAHENFLKCMDATLAASVPKLHALADASRTKQEFVSN